MVVLKIIDTNVDGETDDDAAAYDVDNDILIMIMMSMTMLKKKCEERKK
jgi:hypothetical protein